MKRWKLVWQGSMVLGLVALGAASARAEELDPQALARATALYNQAGELTKVNDFKAACPLLETVTRILPKGIGAREELAKCYVGLGRLASAWMQYKTEIILATAQGDAPAKAFAQGEAEKLEPQLAYVRILVPEEMRNAKGLTVTWDGREQDESVWRAPIPVDAGKHVVEVKALQRKTWTREVDVAKNGVTIDTQVPVLEVVPDSRPSKGAALRPLGFTVLGLGVAGLAMGGVLGGMAIDKWETSGCRADHSCPTREGVELGRQTLVMAHGSTAGLIAGGVLAIGGLAMVLAALKSTENQKKPVSISLQISVQPGSVGLQGVW